MTKEDLRLYQTRVRDPIVGKLKHVGLTMYGPELPSSGVVVQYLLRLLDGNSLLLCLDLSSNMNDVILFSSMCDPPTPPTCHAFSCILQSLLVT